MYISIFNLSFSFFYSSSLSLFDFIVSISFYQFILTGVIIMSLVAMGDGYEYNSKIKFWENVRGE